MRHFGPQHRLPSLDALEANLRPYVIEAFLNENLYWLAFNTGKLLTDDRFLNAAN
jgi:twitching motility protein PilI